MLRCTKFLILFILILSFYDAMPQSILPLDETSQKITFEEIVKVDSTPSLLLYSNAEKWMNKYFKLEKSLQHLDPGSGQLENEGRFLVYTKGISKEIHGAIRFKVIVEIKENKYRYRFTDFVFEYYKQNRQYKYVPTGKEKPLEDKKFPGWEKPWIKHKAETQERIYEYISSLKSAMAFKEIPAKAREVKKKEEW
jgi:hypothetical protein